MAFIGGAESLIAVHLSALNAVTAKYLEALEACKDAQDAAKGAAGGGPTDFLGISLGGDNVFAQVAGLSGCLNRCPRGRRRDPESGGFIDLGPSPKCVEACKRAFPFG